MNVTVMHSGNRILSSFVYGDVKLYVIIEWDRSVTTLMLASNY